MRITTNSIYWYFWQRSKFFVVVVVVVVEFVRKEGVDMRAQFQNFVSHFYSCRLDRRVAMGVLSEVAMLEVC